MGKVETKKYILNLVASSSVIEIKLKETPIDTLDFKLLLQNMKIVSSDSEQLFLDMQINNPFAKEVHHKFKKVSEEIFDKIK